MQPRRSASASGLSLFAATLLLASACSNKVSGVPDDDACSAANPTGVCTGDRVCVDGVCVVEEDECVGTCGGACPPCPIGSVCTDDDDCTTTNCIGDVCREDHCINSIIDGGETGVDCGGTCGACPGGGCAGPTNCASGICLSSGQCADPSCTDGIQNGSETDTDCGGACSLTGGTCPNGADCSEDDDCQSEICNATCQPPASHCTNGVTDGGETGVDCGGGGCQDCATGGGCASGNDCDSGICGVANVCPGPALCTCQDPTCSDGALNGDETGVDCGGTCVGEGKTCDPGDPCLGNTDCTSEVCNLTCQAPSCVPPDGVQNGSETGVDCGGAGCPGCGGGGGCSAPGDCASGVCGVGNVCDTPPCACQDPTCTDGVLNQDERGVDCAGSCLVDGNTCPPGTPCDLPAECSSGFCNSTCQASSCTPPDGQKNGFESDVDCGGPDCAGCAVGGICTTGTDCASGYCDGTDHCAVLTCGDGTKSGTEECDTSDFGGLTCASYFFSGGTLTCTACIISTATCTGGCGNNVVDGAEQCDGTALDGETCASLGYDAGPGLACDENCSFDVSACSSSACPAGGCPTGGYCSVDTDFLCKCPLYQTSCGAACISLLNDPANCGSCGHVCTGGTACIGGECHDNCTPPLVKCGNRCIDPRTDDQFCGASGACTGSNDGTDCTAAQVCLNGQCTGCTGGDCTPPNGGDYTGEGTAPTRCLGGGPVLDLNTGVFNCDPNDPNDPDCPVPPVLGCTGGLAAVSFRYALCSCEDIDTSHPLFVDGFNSSQGPYDPHCENGVTCTVPGTNNGACAADTNGDGLATCADGKGAGIGANGTFDNSQITTVWGTMWLSNGAPASYPDQGLPVTTIEQDLHIGDTLSGGSIRVRGDGYVVNNITASGSFADTLFQSSGRTSTMAAGTVNRTANPLVVPEACDCAPSKLVDVPAIVAGHACLPQGTGGCSGAACCATSNNNNTDIGLDPRVLANRSSDFRVDLPCGQYYFTNITAGSNTTVSLVVHGRTAIHIGGNMDIPKILNITLSDAAELDVFVHGGVCNNDTMYVGSPAYPARVRFYAGGGNLRAGGSGTTCATNATRSMALKSIIGAANLYAPYGEVYMPQTFTLYGSIFAGRARIVQDATFHYDSGIVNAGNTCEKCGNGEVDAGEECDGTALGGATCESLGYSGGPLVCNNACQFDTRACCGDNVRGGAEECDGSDLNGQTNCPAGQTGTLSCSSTCAFQGCAVSACTHNGGITGGEECDRGSPETDPDIFPSNRDSCAEVLGLPAAVGNLSCALDCTIDSTACTYCGDGLRNGTEACDGQDFDVAPGEQNAPPACTSGNGTVSCSSACTLDTSTCTGCGDCRDCNNQACVGGTCGACTDSSQCCAPLLCLAGTCTLF